MTPKQEAAIRKHGEQLQAIFPGTRNDDAVTLCKKLRRLENSARQTAVDWCNGTITEQQVEQRDAKVLSRLGTILWGSARPDVPVFVNHDPRGYALKIGCEWMQEHRVPLHCDWGGYGIIAPEINLLREASWLPSRRFLEACGYLWLGT